MGVLGRDSGICRALALMTTPRVCTYLTELLSPVVHPELQPGMNRNSLSMTTWATFSIDFMK
jgi:hypothetical protein